MRRMRILLIAHLLPYPPHFGCSLRNFNLIRECAKNHDIHLLTFYQKAHLDGSTDLRSNIEEMKKYCKVVKVFEIPTDGRNLAWYSLLFLNLLSPTPYSAWKFHSGAMVRAVREHAASHSFDLVEIGTIALADYAKLVPDLPRLMVHHNIESELLLRRSKNVKGILAKAYLALQGHKLRRFERKACSFFDHHTTVSERDRRTLQEIHPDTKATVVPNGVDTDYFKPVDAAVDENNLVFIGSLSWYPNADAMVCLMRDIWHLIKAKAPNVSMNVIGKLPSKEIKEFSRSHPSFKALGFVEDVRPYVAEAAVYVVPIRVGGGTRLKILDALAMGKAIVSTTVGCEGIDVTDGKDIVIADKPGEFAERTVELMHNRHLREKLGRNARRTAEDVYSWEKIAPKLEQVYEELAGMRK
jgi:sugar transferase (PEP-CTERM/EpsH1 system associated)